MFHSLTKMGKIGPMATWGERLDQSVQGRHGDGGGFPDCTPVEQIVRVIARLGNQHSACSTTRFGKMV